MRLIKFLLPSVLIFTVACDLYDNSELNPRDIDSNLTPGLVFDPVSRTAPVGAAAEFEVYVVAAENLSGVHAQVSYDPNRLSVTNVTSGDFFVDSVQTGQSSFFIYDDDPVAGVLDINYFYMGNEINKTGTGKIATILFNTKQSFDETVLEITDASELVDEDDVDIQILTKGTATVKTN